MIFMLLPRSQTLGPFIQPPPNPLLLFRTWIRRAGRTRDLYRLCADSPRG